MTRLLHSRAMATGWAALVIAVAVAVTGCGDDSVDPDQGNSGTFPEVVAVTVAASENRSYRFDVTISSPYDSPGRYADAWRVVGPDGTTYGGSTR